MNEENKKLLLDALNKDFVKKNKTIAMVCLAAAAVIAILSILAKNYLFIIIAIPFVLVAIFTFYNSKKYAKPETINALVFSEEICTLKTNELSTTGNVRYLEFSNHLRYDISFSEGSMYNQARIGSRFYMITDPIKNCILTLLPVPEDLNTAKSRENLINTTEEAIWDQDILPGLTVSLKNMMDSIEHPIIVCNLLHQIFYLNQSAGNLNVYHEKENLIDFLPSENLISIQKALLAFSNDESCNKATGWKNENNQEIEIYALRNNLNKLSGYYLQRK